MSTIFRHITSHTMVTLSQKSKDGYDLWKRYSLLRFYNFFKISGLSEKATQKSEGFNIPKMYSIKLCNIFIV